MKNQTTRQVLLMVLSGVALCAVFLLGANLIANAYINKAACSALETELQYFETENTMNNDGVYEIEIEASDQTFMVNYLFPSDYELYTNSTFLPYASEESALYKAYCKGKLNSGEITKLSIGDSTYYAVLVRQNGLNIYDDGSLNFVPASIVMYANVSTVQNLVRNLNLFLLPLMVVAVILMAFAGMRSGKKLEDSQRKLKTFFQNASHELKTPLQSIQGYAEGIQTGVIQDERMASDVIMNQSEKMRILIDEILTISKLETGEYQLKNELLNLTEILYDCLYLIKPLADEKGIALIPNIPDDLPEIRGDETQLPKVFNTVLSNAIRYSKNEINIEAKSDSKKITIRILDDGGGISKDDLPHIFDRFYSGIKGNSGIGLSMSREILDRCGGTIQAKNDKKGAVFEIVLFI